MTVEAWPYNFPVPMATDGSRNEDSGTAGDSPVNGSTESIDRDWRLMFFSWLVVMVASLGSMFFSEVMELPPCSLCWYQRIFMFSMVVVLSVGLLPYDRGAARYALALSVFGWLVAGYHVLLYVGVIPESMAPCSRGVSCSEPTFELFGILSIPLLSWLGFTLVTVLLALLVRRRA